MSEQGNPGGEQRVGRARAVPAQGTGSLSGGMTLVGTAVAAQPREKLLNGTLQNAHNFMFRETCLTKRLAGRTALK